MKGFGQWRFEIENEGFFRVSTVISLLAKVFGQQAKSQKQQLQNTEALIYKNQAFQRLDHVWDTLTTYVPCWCWGFMLATGV